MSVPLHAPVPAPPAMRRRSNTLGVVALVMAAVGFLFACVPGALIIGWILLPVSFILGIVSLFRRGESQWQGVTAIIVSVLGTVVGGVVFLVVVADAVDDAAGGDSEGSVAVVRTKDAADVGSAAAGSAETEDVVEASPEAEAGTRENPLPLGTEISSAEWKVVVNSVTFAANDAVLSENMFNEQPPAGEEYILINYTVTYIGDDPEGQVPAWVTVNYVSPDGVTIDGLDTMAVAPDAIDTMTTLYAGGTVEGNIVLSIPSDRATDGVIAVEPGLLEDTVFVAVQ
ncbi:MAG: hypothetical protein Q4C85_01510 [Actinomyces sp.]|uniref:hypothetical protein n=1 Tax=Actinomyces sp. TaxID=29317 RepID=UPI0026DCEAAE|nr:hypothetical protein [Actinomyces sp.]MDO4242440.1 hypothetical protein [Actinomyces sp.]